MHGTRTSALLLTPSGCNGESLDRPIHSPTVRARQTRALLRVAGTCHAASLTVDESPRTLDFGRWSIELVSAAVGWALADTEAVAR